MYLYMYLNTILKIFLYKTDYTCPVLEYLDLHDSDERETSKSGRRRCQWEVTCDWWLSNITF